jgi:hypothetical protein
LRVLTSSMGVSTTYLEAWMTFLASLRICLGASRIAVEQFEKYNNMWGNAAGVPGDHSYYVTLNYFEN